MRYALRSLRRTPGVTAIIVATLALGIGATTAMFSVADAALFRPLPFRDADRIVVVPGIATQLEHGLPTKGRPTVSTIRAMGGAFESGGAYATGQLDLTGGAEPSRVHVAEVTPNLFGILGVTPRIGRPFSSEEERPDAPNVVILSNGIWQRQFGADDHIVGKHVELNARRFEVVGVMPPRFSFPSATDVWIPYTVPLTFERSEIFRVLIQSVGIAKLAPGVTIDRANAQASAALTALVPRPSRRPLPTLLVPLREYYSGDVRPRITVVSGLVLVLILMSCVNVSGLPIARSVSRRREMAIRKAVGASRTRLIRQLFVEGLILAVAGATIGLGVAVVGMRLFISLTPPALESLAPPQLDMRVLATTLSVAVLTALAFGIVPSLLATNQSPAEALKSGAGAGHVSRGTRRITASLVATEVALAVVLLVGSGLMLKSLVRLFAVDTGLRAERVVTAKVSLPRARYLAGFARQRFLDAAIAGLDRAPGIQSAAAVSFLPLAPDPATSFMVEARSGDSSFSVAAEEVHASTKYFSTMGIRVVSGREFTASDSATHVAAINESLAKQWPRGRAIGGKISVLGDTVPRTIVAVVGDIKSNALDGKHTDQVYTPLDDRPPAELTFVVRGSVSADAMFARIRDVVRGVDPRQAISDFHTMAEVATNSVAARRATGGLVIAFGAVALALAGIGIFGLLAFTVSERMPELGIRVALGAQSIDVIRLVLRDAFRVAFVGVVIGSAVAFESAKVLRVILFEVSPTDPLVFAVIPVVIIGVAIVAAMQPGRRAVAVDPLTTMRAQ